MNSLIDVVDVLDEDRVMTSREITLAAASIAELPADRQQR
jgi:hypothetical protein